MRVKTVVCVYASAKNAWKLYIQVKPVYGIVPSRLLVRCSVIRSSACHSFLKEWEVTLPCSYRSTCLFFSSYDAFHHRGGHQVLLRPGLPFQQQRATVNMDLEGDHIVMAQSVPSEFKFPGKQYLM